MMKLAQFGEMMFRELGGYQYGDLALADVSAEYQETMRAFPVH